VNLHLQFAHTCPFSLGSGMLEQFQAERVDIIISNVINKVFGIIVSPS
jgi:hypothetical protein